MKKLLALFLLIIPVFSFAQERKPLKGKVTSSADDLEGIHVINKNTEATIATARGGYFVIEAQVTDTLIFSAVQFVARQVIVEQENFDSGLFFVQLEPVTQTLDEVVIERSNITSESLGLVPKGQKRYTPAERKLYTATDGVDAVFNALSGRTNIVKKIVEVEKKENLMEKINYLYTEEDIINQFHIPQEYVRGFIFYIVEDKYFASAIREKNDTMAKFLMSGLSVKYLELIKDEISKPDDK